MAGKAHRKRLAAGLMTITTLLAALIVLKVRHSKSSLDLWLETHRARGERFTLAELGLENRPPYQSPLLIVVENVQTPLRKFWSVIQSNGSPAPPRSRNPLDPRRWQETQFTSTSGRSCDWTIAESALDALSPALPEVESFLTQTETDPGGDYANLGIRVNFAAIRGLAQALADAEVIELRRGRKQPALTHLLSLIRLANQHADRSTLISQMIRTALLNLTVEGVRDALDAPGWTLTDLAEVQAELQRVELLSKLRHALEVERALGLYFFEAYRKGGPDGLAQAVGGTPAPTSASLGWQRLQHSFWRGFLQNRDELFFLTTFQDWIDGLRQAEKGVPWQALQGSLAVMPDPSRIVGARWFGSASPFVTISGLALPNLTRALSTVLRAETRRRQAILALTLETQFLTSGRWPEHLEDLPSSIPREQTLDPYSDRPFRYNTTPAGRWVLYSVGPNGTDDGGDSTSPNPLDPRYEPGLDIVWPLRPDTRAADSAASPMP